MKIFEDYGTHKIFEKLKNQVTDFVKRGLLKNKSQAQV
jgi:hypothetical protein